MKILRVLGLLLGTALVAVLVHEVGWSSVTDTLGWLGWGYLLVLAYPLSWILLNTAGWWYACPLGSSTITFRELVAIRLAGETFNSLLPSSYVGGEPVKAKLFSAWTTLRQATSSVLIAKSAQSIGLLFFIALGLTLGLPTAPTTMQQTQAWLAFAFLTAGVVIFTILLARGSFSRFGRALHRITRWPWLASQEKRLIALDESLGTFYRDCKGRFFASILWHGAGWVAGMLELVLIFTLMGHPISWREAWFMAALAQLGAVIGLISPGGLGFYEGGHYMAAMLLGLPPSLGLSASLIRRVREIFWDVVGLYFFWRYSKKD